MFDVTINERGQVTIPKELRKKANLYPKDNLYMELDDQGRIILVKKDLLKDLEELIKKDLINEGYTAKDFATKMPEKKKELAQALLNMIEESKKQINSGDYVTLDELKSELNPGD